MTQNKTSPGAQQGENTEHCRVCGGALDYLEQAEELTCAYCGRTEPGYITCRGGHYVCDACHNEASMQAIEETVFTTTLKDPRAIAELMMAHPGLPMLGCQHAHIAAGALIAAIRNEGARDIARGDVEEVFGRIERQAIGGYCGLTGVCGITPAVGAVFAVLLGSKCGTDTEQRLTMEAATRVSAAIRDATGPSCCKAYVRAAVDVAADLLRTELGISLPVSREASACRYVDKHPHGCRSERCVYFSDSTAGAG